MTETVPAENWILLHPVFREMKSLGVEDSAQVHAAFLAYMDLTEVRHWKEVSCLKCPELQLVLLEATEKEGGPTHTVLPLPVHQSITHKSIRCVLDRGFPMLLCAVASDSTLVYQKISDGLVTPEPPMGPFQDVGRRQNRKRRHHPQ
ncbi:tRNA-splicing endonuclease subunit Sen15 [Boleophthalmus pectinirostris]|uniref:tRNA-splicing endonuclease subunit Sen15 n=1 Tax=Boleophthalmus pectinirostris TaxID=150288 RepID=UPI000A1C244D|nr:tRNA-splicing endonuclease subunit Sen15 [Boleophthalmus pectinirostris]